jgi:hypothetical protein
VFCMCVCVSVCLCLCVSCLCDCTHSLHRSIAFYYGCVQAASLCVRARTCLIVCVCAQVEAHAGRAGDGAAAHFRAGECVACTFACEYVVHVCERVRARRRTRAHALLQVMEMLAMKGLNTSAQEDSAKATALATEVGLCACVCVCVPTSVVSRSLTAITPPPLA